MNNGKGDTNHTSDWAAYREGYDAIDWQRAPTDVTISIPDQLKGSSKAASTHGDT